ncbi:MAG: lysostaphin resistance A-like protein [Thermoguttaceae bacterium]
MIFGAICLVIVGWGITFGLDVGNFWVKIGLTVAALAAYAMAWQRPQIRVSWSGAVLGIASAVVLYAIFAIGHIVSAFVVPNAAAQVQNIYHLGGAEASQRLIDGGQMLRIFLLLLFVTGPGEEIFWRGFLQENLARRFGSFRGFLLTTLLYGGIHIFSMNVMLTGAAFVAGSFWGLIYLWRRDTFALIVSHSLWSATIFAIAPIGNV